jgi:peptidoglycan/LPS O-acetylase OafA/YrhL
VSIVAYRTEARGLRILDIKPVRLLGLSSGSHYVLHMTLLMGIVPVIATAILAAWSLQAPALVGPAVIAVAAAVLTVPSLASYYAVEAPGIALGRRVSAGWRQVRLRPRQAPPR